MVDNPPDYWLSEWVLGHVRMKAVEKIKRREVARMYKESHPSDKVDLLDEWGKQ